MVLTELKTGEKGIITHFNNQQLELQLTNMGCPTGSTIELYRKASMGGLISIRTEDGNLLAIRKSEAMHLNIEKND